MSFVHLRTHSHYSLLSALPKVDQLVKEAKKHGMTALALTDYGAMYGMIEFYKACNKHGIKPILGAEIYVAPRGMDTHEHGIDNKCTHLVLLAENNTGYKNIMKIVSKGHIEGYFVKPRIHKSWLKEYSEGVIALSGGLQGDIAEMLKQEDYERAEKLVDEYRNIFGEHNFFLELQNHPKVEYGTEYFERVQKLAEMTKCPLVATQNVHYLSPNDKKAHGTLMAIQESDESRSEMKLIVGNDDFSFVYGDDIENLFGSSPAAIEETQKIADRCTVALELGKWNFPHIELTNGKSHDEAVRELAYKGAIFREVEVTDTVRERIEYELEVIKNKGFSIYFIVVGDLLKYARENGILTNIRGSVAGSLVTYLLGITNVNPLTYKLPFERFLNPERPSAPDIDMDYADNRRDDMLAYARRKYGADKVAQIGTFGTMMAKGAVRDVARAMKFPYMVGDRLSRMIPMGSQGFPMTIEHAIEINPDLKKDYEEDRETLEIIDMARKLEGSARHISVHAAGVVISPTELTDFTPIQLDTKGEGKVISQYDMYSIEEAGLIKFDFLGIRNLAILADAIDLTEKRYGVKVSLDTIDIEDKKTFDMLARGETMGLFQLNGSGMTKYLKELHPTTIFDINAMVALYRPGPIEMIPEYIKRKQNPDLVEYLDPRLEPILDQSYGVITYQDDVMLIAIHLAGYSWLEADKLRKAMGKKIPAEMAEQKIKLMDGFAKHGLSKAKADTLWSLIEPFAAYGFNKAHAASYGRVAYQTAYMKANFPVTYMTAILTAESGDVEKIAEIVSECKRMNIPILPPSIQASEGGFSIHKNEETNTEEIRFGLYTIKNLGTDISDAIIDERKQNGPYTSLSDFLKRVTHKNLNRKSLEALIKSGSMDMIGDRAILLGNLESIIEYHKEVKDNAMQDSLFASSHDIHELKLKEVPPITQKQKLDWEKELLGLFISGHPLDEFKDALSARQNNIRRALEETPDKGEVTIVGIIETLKFVQKKATNEPMCFFKLTDLSGSIEVGAFTKVFPIVKHNLVADNIVIVKGKISSRDDEKMIIVESIQKVEKKN